MQLKRDDIISTLSMQLDEFRVLFVQHELTTSVTASNIMNSMNTNNCKADEFLQAVELELRCSHNPHEVFDTFCKIIAANGNEDVARQIMIKYGKMIHTTMCCNVRT